MTSIQEMMVGIANQLHLNPDEFLAYAMEDAVGGYHIDPAQRKWDMGSLWESEGMALYALVRALKPQRVAEIGGWVGCSAAHIASALRANGGGMLYSVDNGVGGEVHGRAFPPALLPFVDMVQANGQDWLAGQADDSLDLVFEDADHTTALVALVSRLAMQKLRAGGVLVNHDAAHDMAIVGGGQLITSEVGKWVRDGLAQAEVTFRTHKSDESDCGIAVAQKAGIFQTDIHSSRIDDNAKPRAEDWQGNYVTDDVAKQEADASPVVEPAPAPMDLDLHPDFVTMEKLDKVAHDNPLSDEQLEALEPGSPAMADRLHQVWPELYPEPEAREDIKAEGEPIMQPEKPIKRKPGRKPKVH